jgi:hypothetical protein
MAKIREQIIHKSTHEAEKNKSIFFNEIDSIKVYSTHVKVWVVDRDIEDGKKQPILLLNCDTNHLPHDVRKNYGVLVLTPNASRYSEAVGVLVRKTFTSFEEQVGETIEQTKKIFVPPLVENILRTVNRCLGSKIK